MLGWANLEDKLDLRILATKILSTKRVLFNADILFLSPTSIKTIQILIIITLLIHSKFFLYEFSAPEIFFELLRNYIVHFVVLSSSLVAIFYNH